MHPTVTWPVAWFEKFHALPAKPRDRLTTVGGQSLITPSGQSHKARPRFSSALQSMHWIVREKTDPMLEDCKAPEDPGT